MDHIMNTTEDQDEAIIGREEASNSASHESSLSSMMMSSSQSQSSSATAFVPDEDSLKMLLEMGYAREDAVIALRICGNHLE